MPLSCKQMGFAWGISPTKTTQKKQHVFRAYALAALLYPQETAEEVARYMAEAQRELDERTEGEICVREAMLNGRLDRSRVHP